MTGGWEATEMESEDWLGLLRVAGADGVGSWDLEC